MVFCVFWNLSNRLHFGFELIEHVWNTFTDKVHWLLHHTNCAAITIFSFTSSSSCTCIPTHPCLYGMKYKIQNCKSFTNVVRFDIYTPFMFGISFFMFVIQFTVVK